MRKTQQDGKDEWNGLVVMEKVMRVKVTSKRIKKEDGMREREGK